MNELYFIACLLYKLVYSPERPPLPLPLLTPISMPFIEISRGMKNDAGLLINALGCD